MILQKLCLLLAPVFSMAVCSAEPPSQALSAEMLLGQYRREPMLNNWHQGVIEFDTTVGNGKLRWRNDAGASWGLTPDLPNLKLVTDASGNPYYLSQPERGRAFRIRLRSDGSVDGFEFMGDFYARVSSTAAAVPVLNSSKTACIPPLAGMVGWWPGDGDSKDIIGGNNPTGVNAVSLVSSEVASGFKFGFEGYLHIPRSPSLENQRFTWLAWARPDGPGPNGSSIIINQNIDGNHAAIALAWRPNDERFTFCSGTCRDELVVSMDAFPAGVFYLVAASYDGRTFRLYVNGALEGALSETKVVPYSEYGWEIGAGALRFFPRFADTFNGVIDEVQAYNRALSVEEIQSIYEARGAGVCKPAGIAPAVSTAAINLPPTPDTGPAVQNQLHDPLSRLNDPPDTGSVSPGKLHAKLNSKDGLQYMWIPPGSFSMGCSEGDTECGPKEPPAHIEHLEKGFWIGQMEVTQFAYTKIMGTNPSKHQGDTLPVESVTWDDALKYCQATGGHLPNEMEWEYAERAGSKWARYGNVDAVAWYSGNSNNETHPVGMKKPNAFGLFDMLGNVWEWLEDSDPNTGAKLERGGSAFGNVSEIRASSGRSDSATGWAASVGFRCTADWPAPNLTALADTNLPPGVFRAGGDVTAPRILRKVEPEYSLAARQAKISGTVRMSVIIGINGRATDFRVIQPLGYGLDEKAIEAVQKWKFSPGMKDGHPVPVRAMIEVSFRLL